MQAPSHFIQQLELDLYLTRFAVHCHYTATCSPGAVAAGMPSHMSGRVDYQGSDVVELESLQASLRVQLLNMLVANTSVRGAA